MGGDQKYRRNMICALAGPLLLLTSIPPSLADEFADDDQSTGYVGSCKTLVESLRLVLNNANDPVTSWDEPVKECFEEAHKKTKLAFECGPEFEEVCVEHFRGTANYDEAVGLRGSFEEKLLSGESFSIAPSLFL